MSEPMRFNLKHHGQLSCLEHCPKGEWVMYIDYASLLNKHNQLDAQLRMEAWTTPIEPHIMAEEIKRLKAEVNQLRKAAWEVCDKWEHSVHGKVEWCFIADLRDASKYGIEEQL